MVRQRGPFTCRDCAAVVTQMLGRCPACGSWGSLEAGGRPHRRDRPGAPAGAAGPGGTAGAVRVADLEPGGARPVPTGMAEVDRVLGGGLVAGSVTLLTGEPGVGKSTLAVQVLASLASRGSRCLLVSAEESARQVGSRAERLLSPAGLAADLWVASLTDLDEIEGHVADLAPSHLVVDSIQTISDASVAASAGSVSQVRECAQRLAVLAKATGTTVILVGHVTKDGSLAGPRTLEHLVDTVLVFTGDRYHSLRMLRATKHRFGATGELGLFEMGDAGLVAVDDPAELFLCDRSSGVPGSVAIPAIEGQRPLVVELQALVASPSGGPPRRSTQGLDSGRLGMVLAVLDRRVGLRVSSSDVYALVIGGVKISEPSADLGMAVAVASSLADVAVADDLVACGEIGLGGEIRQVPDIGRRLAEAARLGFRRALVPASAPDGPVGLEILRAPTVAAALAAAGLIERPSAAAPPGPERTVPSPPAGTIAPCPPNGLAH